MPLKKLILLLIIILTVGLMFSGCAKEEPPFTPETESNPEDDPANDDPSNIIQMLNNINAENESGPLDFWWNYSGNSNEYISTWASNYYVSSNHSLKINCISSISDINSLGFWAQTINSNIPIGKQLTLKAIIKIENVIGDGVSIAIRGDDTTFPSDMAEVFSTTEGQVNINGTKDWTEYGVVLDNVPSNIKSITVYLILLYNTTGTAYFDDITLTYIE